MSKLPTALLRSRRHGAVIAVALALIASILTLTLDSPAEAAPGWNHETLDSGASTGEGLSTIYWPPYLQHHVFNSGIESSERVLRHGWYQPGFSNWAFETLDQGNSTGMASATGLWDIQHHVFNTGDESGAPVLRHGWYQPGFSNWAFETLDAGVSTGTDTAYAEYSGQQHVFTHGLSPTGEDILRHGYYDPGIGSWIFETLDQGFSEGSALSAMVWQNQLHIFNRTFGTMVGLRHGWYEPAVGWRFEALGTPSPANGDFGYSTMSTVAIATADGNQNVWFSAWTPPFPPGSVFFMNHGWFDPEVGSWQFAESQWIGLGKGSRAVPDGRSISATQFGDHVEVFDFSSVYPGDGSACFGMYHAYWDGMSWNTEIRPGTSPCGDLPRSPIAASAYPPFNQLHAFYAQDPPAMGHFWYNPG